ncbi:uncharacterized protein LOC132004215 isoform X2 [Mustela nigripes]|uniref:uncharacterized protein LOC132004215 isoform X2 n=1 Tax=Mustela nigripes TaxID=77151 RepID=UPI0028168A79|nr:uncharacterized protein LOC132004215 isoform X2 [Mustela nigripes]
MATAPACKRRRSWERPPVLLGTARSSGLPASHGVFEEACPERQGTDSKDAEGGPALSGLWSTIPPLKNQLQLLLLPAPAPLATPPASAPPAPLQHQDHSHPSYYSTKSGGKMEAIVYHGSEMLAWGLLGTSGDKEEESDLCKTKAGFGAHLPHQEGLQGPHSDQTLMAQRTQDRNDRTCPARKPAKSHLTSCIYPKREPPMSCFPTPLLMPNVWGFSHTHQ